MMAIHNASSVKGTDRWSTASPEASEQSDAAEFAGAVAAAEVVAAQAGQPKAPEVLSPDVPHQVGDVKAQAAGKLDKILPRSAGGSAESASQIQKMAVSSNTGVDIAGLKPWSPDWVFEGGMNQHPAQKTLVGGQEGGESATAVSELEQLLRQSGAVMADSSDKRSAPVEGAGQSMNRPALSKSTKSSSALAGDDFLGMRQVSTATKSVKPSLGAPQGVPGPEVGPRIPGEMTPVSERKQERMKLPDTLGLLHPTGDKPDSRANVLPFEAGASALRLDGGVVAGSMSKDRLTTESVSGIAQSIRQLSNGGEVRIRLKPDHLGELHLKVTTGGKTGSDVGLQIQASDSRAKKTFRTEFTECIVSLQSKYHSSKKSGK